MTFTEKLCILYIYLTKTKKTMTTVKQAQVKLRLRTITVTKKEFDENHSIALHFKGEGYYNFIEFVANDRKYVTLFFANKYDVAEYNLSLETVKELRQRCKDAKISVYSLNSVKTKRSKESLQNEIDLEFAKVVDSNYENYDEFTKKYGYIKYNIDALYSSTSIKDFHVTLSRRNVRSYDVVFKKTLSKKSQLISSLLYESNIADVLGYVPTDF